MLEPKEVIDKARIHLRDVLPEFAALQPKVDEVAKSPNSSEWKISFVAYCEDRPESQSLADILRRRRIEKVVSVDAEDGALIAVKNPHEPV